MSQLLEIRTLNFIFDETFLKRYFPEDTPTSFFSIPIPTVSDEEKKLLFDCSVFVASHSFLDSKKYIRNKIQAAEEGLAVELMRHYSQRSNLWLQSTSYPTPPPSLVQNEDTYTQVIVKGIILGVVSDLELMDHW